MSGFLHATVLDHDGLETVIASHLAEKMGNAEIGAAHWGRFSRKVSSIIPIWVKLCEPISSHIMTAIRMPVISRSSFILQRVSGLAGLSGGALDD